ncbi:hypothetical protein BC833DRAFT_617614 [Globomyces pollinis-pini]|nr:hypothetical protein BC833DRAFT_617614 [Globomyces pollinis-pini]
MQKEIKLKNKLKDWEDRFFLKNQRAATKEDVAAHPKVANVYQQLKEIKRLKKKDDKFGLSSIAEDNSKDKKVNHEPGKNQILINKCQNEESVVSPRMSNQDFANQLLEATPKKSKPDLIFPSPFKPSKSLFRSLSTSNVLTESKVTTLSQSESFFESKENVSRFIRNNSDMDLYTTSKVRADDNPFHSKEKINPQNEDDCKSKLRKGPLLSIPNITIPMEEKDSIDKIPTVTNILSISPTANRAFGYDLNKSQSEKKSNPTAGVIIEESDLTESYAIRKLIPGKRKSNLLNTTSSPKWWENKSSAIEDSISTKAIKNISTARMFVQPNQNINSRILKRHNSYTIGDLPTNYSEFLTKEEERKFQSIIKLANNEPESHIPVVEIDEDRIDNQRSKCLAQSEPKRIAAPKIKHPTKIRKNDQSSVINSVEDFSDMSTDDYQPHSSISKRHTIVSSDSDGMEEELKPVMSKKVKTVKRPKASPKTDSKNDSINKKPVESGWNNSAGKKPTGNQNYRAFNLKSKYKGKSSSSGASYKVGQSKFHKTKKLSSYNYSKSDGNSLLAGYNDETVGVADVDGQQSSSISGSLKIDFIFSEPNTSLVPVSSIYTSPSENVYVDLDMALESLTGFKTFRFEQRLVIERILDSSSTLLVLPTGGGKSLCYQLPSFILRHVVKIHTMVLVVCPTISLMHDQLRCLPKGLRGAALSSGAQNGTNKSVSDKILSGSIDILFVSPERLRSDSFLELIQSPQFPKISFCCVDEVHCVSEWSHNFRTSYLHLHSSLIEKLHISCILGLTGTATNAAKGSICQMLNIDPDEGVIGCGFLRHNLRLTVTKIGDMENREATLLALLRSEKFKSFQSIIIYVMFQYQADQLAQYLRIRDIDAESYHSGKPSEERIMTQTRFLRGKIPVIIATVAFGMGINKENVDSVIHYCLPKTFENYIQEIGRAGRDGREAHCHLFLSREDYVKHRSFAFSEKVERQNLLKILEYLFPISNTTTSTVSSHIIKTLEKQFDIKKESLMTILSYLEIRFQDCIQILPNLDTQYNLYLINGTKVDELYELNSTFYSLFKLSSKSRGGFEFDIVQVSNDCNVLPRDISSLLWNLQMKKKIRFTTDLNAIQIQTNHVDWKRNYKSIDNFYETITDWLIEKLTSMDQIRVLKLDEIYDCFYNVAMESHTTIESYEDNELIARQEQLVDRLKDYFARSNDDEMKASKEKNKWGFKDPYLIEKQKQCQMSIEIAIKQFVRTHLDILDCGDNVARIFHGIPSPKFPAFEWNTNEYWGKYSFYNFKDLTRMASTVLDLYRSKKQLNQ